MLRTKLSSGLEIKETNLGLEVCQRQSVNELLLRHPEVQSTAWTPCCGWKESFDDGETREDTPDVAKIRLSTILNERVVAVGCKGPSRALVPCVPHGSALCKTSSRRHRDRKGCFKILERDPILRFVVWPG